MLQSQDGRPDVECLSVHQGALGYAWYQAISTDLSGEKSKDLASGLLPSIGLAATADDATFVAAAAAASAWACKGEARNVT